MVSLPLSLLIYSVYSLHLLHTGTTKNTLHSGHTVQVYYCNYLFSVLTFIVNEIRSFFSHSPSCVCLSVCFSHAAGRLLSTSHTLSSPFAFWLKTLWFIRTASSSGSCCGPHTHLVQLTSDFICVTLCGCKCEWKQVIWFVSDAKDRDAGGVLQNQRVKSLKVSLTVAFMAI